MPRKQALPIVRSEVELSSSGGLRLLSGLSPPVVFCLPPRGDARAARQVSLGAVCALCSQLVKELEAVAHPALDALTKHVRARPAAPNPNPNPLQRPPSRSYGAPRPPGCSAQCGARLRAASRAAPAIRHARARCAPPLPPARPATHAWHLRRPCRPLMQGAPPPSPWFWEFGHRRARAQVTTGNLERVRKVKTRHQRLWTRVVTVREELQARLPGPARAPSAGRVADGAVRRAGERPCVRCGC